MKTHLLSLTFVVAFFGCTTANDTTRVNAFKKVWSEADFFKEVEQSRVWLINYQDLAVEQYLHLVYLYNTIVLDSTKRETHKDFLNSYTSNVRRTIGEKLSFDISVRCSYSKKYDLYFGCNTNGTSVYTIIE